MAAPLDALQQTQMLAGLAALLLWEHAHPFFDYFRKTPKERGKHALRNLLLGELNAAVVSIVFVGLWGAAAIWAGQQGVGLLHWLEATLGLPLWAPAKPPNAAALASDDASLDENAQLKPKESAQQTD